MIYLVNRVCYLPNRIEQQLSECGIDYISVTEKEWYYSQIHSFLSPFLHNYDIWLHVWDDHPFMCGPYFQDALEKGIISGRNNIFVVYNDSYRLNLWHQKLLEDINEKFSLIYSSDETIDSHIFLVNSEIGEHFDALVGAIKEANGKRVPMLFDDYDIM